MPTLPTGLDAFALLCVSSLIAMLNPLAAGPMYLALTADQSAERRRVTLLRAMITVLVILLTFALLGRAIFQTFGITIHAFRIAGGFILFGIGMDMLQAKRSRVKATEEEEREGMEKDEVGITPLGVPMIAGPGSITTVMVLMTQAETPAHVGVLLAAIGLVVAVCWLVLSTAHRITVFFGQTGLNVMTRIMGLLVSVIAVQFVIDGARPVLVEIVRLAGGAA
jgi:multiple antibiotic resistance protein